MELNRSVSKFSIVFFAFFMVFSFHDLFAWSFLDLVVFLMVFSHGLFALMVFSHGLCCLFMVSLWHGLWPHLFAKVGPS